jgi:hypothetical protein
MEKDWNVWDQKRTFSLVVIADRDIPARAAMQQGAEWSVSTRFLLRSTQTTHTYTFFRAVHGLLTWLRCAS